MKHRIWSLVLAVCMALTLAVPAAAANDAAIQTVQVLGIMAGNEKGDLMLDSNVTRAQFVTMMTRASTFKDSISPDGSGYSLFKDVKSSHWASEYIRLAVQEGWMSGYIDGTFRPDQTITLEEACTALLRMLGYDSATLAGSFPAAQLNKAASIGLRDELSAKQGAAMTRRECAKLFYNLLTAQTAEGQVYATTLGYTVTNGEVDHGSVALNNLSGPYVADSGAALPFTPDTIYRDGAVSTSSSLNQYDVYYYNKGLGTAWIYTERVAGKITQLSPNSTAPTSVAVAGKEYTIGSTSAAYQLSVFNGGSTGAVVTLLLGMDDEVIGVVTGEEVDMIYYGVVESYSKGVATEGDAAVETTVTVICTDGVSRTFAVEKDASYTADRIVSVNVSGGEVTIKQLSEKSLSGKVNSAGTKFGDYTFANNVKIIDTSDGGSVVTVEPERLAGNSISSSYVRYYTLNEDDEIEHLILENATGDTWSYAYMTSVDDQSQQMNINVTYKYVLNGTETTMQSSGVKYPVDTGGVGISYKSDGSIKSMRQMDSIRLTELGVQTAMANNKKYTLADELQVYLRKNGSFYLTSLSSINADDYSVTGWYDTGSSAAGGQIRIIIATEKT